MSACLLGGYGSPCGFPGAMAKQGLDVVPRKLQEMAPPLKGLSKAPDSVRILTFQEEPIMHLMGVGLFLIAGIHLASAADGAAGSAPANDYPTSARAEYVFACMKSNGETAQALKQCSCAIDVIASLLPYDAYVAAETVASMQQGAGQIGAMFSDTAIAREDLARLRRAQAEADVRCFL